MVNSVQIVGITRVEVDNGNRKLSAVPDRENHEKWEKAHANTNMKSCEHTYLRMQGSSFFALDGLHVDFWSC